MFSRALSLSLASPGSQGLVAVPHRGFKRKKLTNEDIMKALETKQKQRKSYLDQYYGKYKSENSDRSMLDGRELLEKNIKSREKKGKKHIDKSDEDNEKGSYKAFVRSHVSDVRELNKHAVDPMWSERARRKAWSLHTAEPLYWTSGRLAALFRIKPARMRQAMFGSKLEAEAALTGMEFDDKIENLFSRTFGERDMPQDYDMKPPEEYVIRKMHNPWYYINPGLQSANLLRFTRQRENKHYREASRIPAQRVNAMETFVPHLPKSAPKRRVAAKDKKYKMTLVDTSPHYTLYDRHIVIREGDNTFRTATWNERRHVNDARRHIKIPYHVPFPWPDENQHDTIPVKFKPPPSYRVLYEDHEGFEAMTANREEDTRLALLEAEKEYVETVTGHPNEGVLLTKVPRRRGKRVITLDKEDDSRDGGEGEMSTEDRMAARTDLTNARVEYDQPIPDEESEVGEY